MNDDFKDWNHKEPIEEGHYWFYGERYKPMGKELPYYELVFCTARKGANSMLITGDGQLFFDSEYGEQWWFKKAELPEFPKVK